MKKIQNFDESYRIFVQQAKMKRKWRDERIKEISQIANEKIDPDLFVGGANNTKTSQYTQVEARIKQKMYSMRQGQEKLVFQRNQLQELTQAPTQTNRPVTQATNRPGTQSGAIQQSKTLLGQTLTLTENSNSSVFYHNDNTDHKWFLNSKWKIPSNEENKSRILFTANSTFRGADNNTSHHDLLSATTYQAFAGSFRQLTSNDTSLLHEQKAEEIEANKSLLLIENPNLANQVPKGWNLNVIDDEFRAIDDEEREKEEESGSKSPNAGKPSGSRKARITNVNHKKHFTDAESMMNHTINAKKRIQQKLQEHSFVKNTGASMYNFDEMEGGKTKKFKLIQMGKYRANTSEEQPRPNGHQEKKKIEDYNAHVEERNVPVILRQRISTREDDRSHELGNWSALMSFLPQRVKLVTENPKPHPPNSELGTTNKNLPSQGPDASRAILMEGQKQIETAHVKIRDGDRSRGNLSQPQSQPESRNRTPNRQRILVVGSGVSDKHQTRVLDASPHDKRSYSVDVGRRMHERIHSKNDFDRGRLFDYNIMQKFKRRTKASPGFQKSYVDEEKEKEKLLRTYEKFKNLKMQSMFHKMH